MKGVVPLFPTALFVSSQYEITPSERSFLMGLEWEQNRLGNYSSKDSYVLESDELRSLRQFLDLQVDYYAHEVLRISRTLDVYITQSWVNRNPAGSSHHPHFHPNSLISGVFFIQGEDCPFIVHREDQLFGNLSLDIEGRSEFNQMKRRINNRSGHAVIFPSGLRHEVEKNSAESDRYSLSFNTFAKGVLGSRQRLTELKL